MTFKVDRLHKVTRRLLDLAELATARRIRRAYNDAIVLMLDTLQQCPLDWGDPVYRTKLPGGLVCHAIAWPILVR